MFTAVSTLAHWMGPAAHRLKPLCLRVRAIIYDNSQECAGYRHLARTLHIQACFAAAYHAGERGVNENTNGLIRDFFPMGTDFSTNRPAIVAKGERLLNSRSGKALGIPHVKNNARK
jgi:IS30 family transposase